MDITRQAGWTCIYMPFTDLTGWQHHALNHMLDDYHDLHSPPHMPRRFPPPMGGRQGINIILPTAEEHLALTMIQRAKEAPDPSKQDEREGQR